MKALAGATTALTAYNAYQGMQNPNTSGGGVGISITVGGSKSKDTSSVTTDTAAASTVAAGGDVTIRASGAGEQSDITVQGSQIDAGRDLTLIAEDDIALLAAANTASVERSSQSSSSGVGVAITYGSDGFAFGITANASAARGNAEGDDLILSNTQLAAGDTLTLRSGDDTTLKGAVASGERVVADVGGDLSIESLQDLSTYESRDKSAGGSVTIGYGFAGSVQIGEAKVDSDFASVAEQSALRAGDGGFDVRVGGDTTLTAGAITSTDGAVDGGLNHFETGGELALVDIHNRAEYEGKSVGVSIGAGTSTDGKLAPQGTSAGVGEDSDKASSTTVAAISGIAGNVDARTGDAETGLKPIFDADKLQREIDAQVVITQAFGPRAAKAWGDYANTKALEAAARGDFEEAENWAEGGAYRIAGHTLLGALSGGVDGATGGLVSSVAMKHVAELLKQTDLPEGAQSALSATIAASLGAIAGPTGAAAAFNVDTNNRQLHPDEVKWIRDNAKRFADMYNLSPEEAEQRLAQQAFRQVQFGAEGGHENWDHSAEKFLAQAGKQLLPGDPTVGGHTIGYMFYATPEERANAYIYLSSAISNSEFYEQHGLQQPTSEALIRAAQRDAEIRGNLNTATKTALGASATIALIGLSPAMLEWALTNPIAATEAGVISAETAAGIISGAVTPAGLLQQIRNPQTAHVVYERLGLAATKNASSNEVVLGRYIAGSSESYEQIAAARGAAYYEVGAWDAMLKELGRDKMWEINKSFLDKAIADGKTILFTSDPKVILKSDPTSFSAKEIDHLTAHRYSFVKEGEFFRAVK